VGLHEWTLLAFVFHIGGGTIGLLSGTAAVLAAKGGRLHRLAGNVFFVSMTVMAVFAICLGLLIPNQIVNAFIGTFVLYLVATAWLTVRRGEERSGLAEKAALAVALVLLAPFAILSFQLATGLPPLFKSAMPLKGPVLVAIYSFTAVLAIAAAGDAKVVFRGGISGAPRIARHLWRMCLGLTLATGSAFTNGLSRLIPGPEPWFFLYVQFIPLALLVFWMIRVRLTGWYKASGAALQA